jgi:tetratricopeptide (TPR) repeat protein
MDRVRTETIVVDIDGERIAHEVYLDEETNMDIDPNTGVFRTRAESEALVREVFNIGKVSMRGELERYNKWIRTGSGQKHQSNLLKKVDSLGVTSRSSCAVSTGTEESFGGVEAVKNRGNECLGRGDLRKALGHYLAAASMLTAQKKKNMTESETLLLAVCRSNAAETAIRLERFNEALELASLSLEADPAREKSHYRKCLALLRLGRLAECRAAIAFLEEQKGALSAEWADLKKRAETVGALQMCPKTRRLVSSTDVRPGDVLLELHVTVFPTSRTNAEDDVLALCRWYCGPEGAEARSAVSALVGLCGSVTLVSVSSGTCQVVKQLASIDKDASHECLCSALVFLLCVGKLQGSVESYWREELDDSLAFGDGQLAVVLGRCRLTRSDEDPPRNATATASSCRKTWQIVASTSFSRGTPVFAFDPR